jgi:hypothetical protein
MNMMTNFKSITLLTQTGVGGEIVHKLFEAGHRMVDLHHARGSIVGGPLNKKGEPIEGEQEIITCLVESDRANDVFAMIYDWAGLDKPHGGFMYMQDLSGTTVQALPDHIEKTN